MQWLQDLSYLFGGACLANAVPHLVSGLTGRPFQSPFAKPPRQRVVVIDDQRPVGFFNLMIGYGLICRIGRFDLRATDHALALGAGLLVTSLVLARIFGRFHGGNAPRGS